MCILVLEVLYQIFLTRVLVCIVMRMWGKEVVTAINSSQLSIDSDDESIQWKYSVMHLYCLVEY